MMENPIRRFLKTYDVEWWEADDCFYIAIHCVHLETRIWSTEVHLCRTLGEVKAALGY